jgi:hypothetical protein
MAKKSLKLAGRKWKRQFEEAAVAQSFAKTITEPVTNSYDSYKRLAPSAARSTGLVSRVLAIRKGEHVAHEDIVAELPIQTSKTISIRLGRSRASDLERKECQIVDFAEGMSAEEIDEKFEHYGSEKSGAGSGKGVRGLFGQGLCDVLFSHSPGTIRSIKDGTASECHFSWSSSDAPEYEVRNLGAATKKLRKDWGIPENGTVVSFQLTDRCRVPQQDEMAVARLANFYMLRLINADPSTRVVLEQVRRDKNSEQELRFAFPRGQILEHIETVIGYESYAPIRVEGVVIRADTNLPTREAGDERMNGLLIVDEADTVYDQTLFSKYDANGFLDQLYGIIRLTGVRSIIRDELNAGNAVITESRDGFDTSKGLYKALETGLMPFLEPIYKKEIERKSASDGSLSEASEKRVKKALRKLNEFFEEITKEPGTAGSVGDGVSIPEPIRFETDRIQLRLAQPRRLRLLGNPQVVKEGAAVLFDSDQAGIRVEPSSASWQRVAGKDHLLSVQVSVVSNTLGLQGNIIAVSQDRDDKSLEASLSVLETLPPAFVDPPVTGLEFSPQQATAAPSKRGTVSLLVDPSKIPIGSEILVSIQGGSPLKLVAEPSGDDVTQVALVVRNADMLPGVRVARIGIVFRGYGFGQRAKLRAVCFVGKTMFEAEAQLLIQETQTSSGGIFKGVAYKELSGTMRMLSSEFEPLEGKIVVNKLHPINRAAFGVTQESFSESISGAQAAQLRLAEVIVDQCLFHTLAVAHQNSQISLPKDDEISAMRRKIEEFKYERAEAVYKEFVDGFKVPRFP